MKLKKELISRITDFDPFVNEEEILKLKKQKIEEFKKKIRVSQEKIQMDRKNAPDNIISHITKLLRNKDPNCLPYLEHNKMLDPNVQNLGSFGDLQNFRIQDSCSPSDTTCVKVPQKSMEIYNCILEQTKIVKPPNITLESYSPFRAK